MHWVTSWAVLVCWMGHILVEAIKKDITPHLSKDTFVATASIDLSEESLVEEKLNAALSKVEAFVFLWIGSHLCTVAGRLPLFESYSYQQCGRHCWGSAEATARTIKSGYYSEALLLEHWVLHLFDCCFSSQIFWSWEARCCQHFQFSSKGSVWMLVPLLCQPGCKKNCTWCTC